MTRLADVGLFTDEPAYRPLHARAEVIEATGKDPAIDWQLVVGLRRKASELISASTSGAGQPLPEVDRRLLGRSIIRGVVRDHVEALSASGQALWPVEVEHACAQAVENAIFGYGRLQPLFEIAEAENIEIHGCDSVVVQFGDGHRESRPPVADSDAELVEAIRFLGESASPARPFDDAHPMLTLGETQNHLTGQDTLCLQIVPPVVTRLSPGSRRWDARDDRGLGSPSARIRAFSDARRSKPPYCCVLDTDFDSGCPVGLWGTDPDGVVRIARRGGPSAAPKAPEFSAFLRWRRFRTHWHGLLSVSKLICGDPQGSSAGDDLA